MIVSNDSIIKPPYDITSNILQLLTAISEQIGDKINPSSLKNPSHSHFLLTSANRNKMRPNRQ